MSEHKEQIIKGHDVGIIRPLVIAEDFSLRGSDMSAERKKSIRKALKTLHTLETMAVNIYKFQLPKNQSEMKRQLIAAMCNEMTHLQDFQVKLYEFGFKPSRFRWAYWLVGFAFGFGSKILGRKMMLRTGIWVETKAVHHYAQLLSEVEWDPDTRAVVGKNGADEEGHINRWKSLLDNGSY